MLLSLSYYLAFSLFYYSYFKFWTKKPSSRYIPLLVQANLEPFLKPTNLPDTKSSSDPLLIAKPISTDSEEIPVETKRNVQIIICQNGGSLELDR